ncbi:19860_t:CDS:2, partial [Gigaspora rosea]
LIAGVVVLTQELSVYTTLSWKHFVVESPARKFLNLVLDLKTSAELRNAKIFRKIEPILGENKSKKLCTLWKCLQGKLPVLAEPSGTRSILRSGNQDVSLLRTEKSRGITRKKGSTRASGPQDEVRKKISAPIEEINECWLDSIE